MIQRKLYWNNNTLFDTGTLVCAATQAERLVAPTTNPNPRPSPSPSPSPNPPPRKLAIQA